MQIILTVGTRNTEEESEMIEKVDSAESVVDEIKYAIAEKLSKNIDAELLKLAEIDNHENVGYVGANSTAI